jgi:D-arginine dehydrogenase
MSDYDFLIVGGGIAGVSVAAELASRASVVVIEREPALAYHSTGRSAALFIETYGPPQIQSLTRASRAFLDHPPEGFADASLLSPRGVLHLAGPERPEGATALADEFAGQPGRLLSADECVALVPILRRDAIAGGYLETDAMDLDVHAIHQGFLRQARARGARVFTGVPEQVFERVELDGGVAGWSVMVDGERVQARVVIDAAGAWADQVAVSMGAAPMGLTPLRRTALLVDPPAGYDIAAWPAVIDADEGFYFKPDAGKLLLSPADATPSAPCDAAPDEMDVAIAVDRVQQAADLPVRRVNHAWAGLRTFGPDGLPVVGYDPAVEGLFWLAGQGGYGIQTSPAMAKLAAALALGEGVPEDLVRFGVDAALLAPVSGRLGR